MDLPLKTTHEAVKEREEELYKNKAKDKIFIQEEREHLCNLKEDEDESETEDEICMKKNMEKENEFLNMNKKPSFGFKLDLSKVQKNNSGREGNLKMKFGGKEFSSPEPVNKNNRYSAGQDILSDGKSNELVEELERSPYFEENEHSAEYVEKPLLRKLHKLHQMSQISEQTEQTEKTDKNHNSGSSNSLRSSSPTASPFLLDMRNPFDPPILHVSNPSTPPSLSNKIQTEKHQITSSSNSEHENEIEEQNKNMDTFGAGKMNEKIKMDCKPLFKEEDYGNDVRNDVLDISTEAIHNIISHRQLQQQQNQQIEQMNFIPCHENKLNPLLQEKLKLKLPKNLLSKILFFQYGFRRN